VLFKELEDSIARMAILKARENRGRKQVPADVAGAAATLEAQRLLHELWLREERFRRQVQYIQGDLWELQGEIDRVLDQINTILAEDVKTLGG